MEKLNFVKDAFDRFAIRHHENRGCRMAENYLTVCQYQFQKQA
jgi:hypothetical protein